jgi:hypothetical protein
MKSSHPALWKLWVPAVFAVAAIAVVVNQLIAEPRESLLGLSMVLVRLPVYAVWVRRKAFQRNVQP